jgi:hypothetical protein
MNTKTGKIERIAADGETIRIEGRCPGAGDGDTLAVHILEPFVPLPAEIAGAPNFGAAIDERKDNRFSLAIDRFHRGRDLLFAKFAVGSRPVREGTTRLFSGPCFVTDLSDISRSAYPYPTSATIKGLQVRDVGDALALGVGHAALNLNLPNIARPQASPTTITYMMDGQPFYFDEPYLQRFDRQLKSLSDHGIVVNLILLNSMKWDGETIHPDMHEVLLHPDYDREGFISAFNVVTAQGLAHYRAFVEFIAERYTRPDQKYGRACGYIIGNEVDTQWVWCNAGEKALADYLREHGNAMRIAFFAARKHYAEARVYLSLTHHWTSRWEVDGVSNPLRSYAGRELIEALNALYKAEGDYDWSLAYHPYPEDLFHPDFWHDEAAQDSFDTPKITFRNLQILPRYFAQSHLLYAGRQRHIILSEQGFHSDETEEGEQLQAAAYAFAYWKVEQEPGIESFILHAHIDNRDEFDLNLGIRRRDKTVDLPSAPGSAKPVYAVFRDINGPRHDEIMAEAKLIVGEENWR